MPSALSLLSLAVSLGRFRTRLHVPMLLAAVPLLGVSVDGPPAVSTYHVPSAAVWWDLSFELLMDRLPRVDHQQRRADRPARRYCPRRRPAAALPGR